MREIHRVSWILAILLLTIVTMSKGGKFHENSFITEQVALQYIYHGKSLASSDPIVSIEYFHKSFLSHPSVFALEAAGIIRTLLGDAPGVGPWISGAQSKYQPYLEYTSILNVCANLYDQQNWNDALHLISQWTQTAPCSIQLLNFAALIHQKRGRLTSAQLIYGHILDCFPIHTSTFVNLGTMYQQHNDREMRKKAINLYKFGIKTLKTYRNALPQYFFLNDNEFKMMSNLGLAYYQQLQFEDAFAATQSLIELALRGIDTINKYNSTIDSSSWKYSLEGALGNQVIIARAALDWRDGEERLHQVLLASIEKLMKNENLPSLDPLVLQMLKGPYLPFDSLLDDVSMMEKLQVAKLASLFLKHQSLPISSLPVVPRSSSSLNIVMYSTDFNDHPTAHLIVSLVFFLHFQKIQKMTPTWYQQIRLICYNYGKEDDSSSYRHILKTYVDKFVDSKDLDHKLFLEDIANLDKIDVFLEMQVHTLNNRLDVTRSLALSQPLSSVNKFRESESFPGISSFVNYLVYPGTSGTTFLNHIVCDKIVIPAEHAIWYSEKLLMLPPTYQMSSYYGLGLVPSDQVRNMSMIYNKEDLQDMPFFPQTIDDIEYLRRLYRRSYGLPEDDEAIIFANFNKIDKLDPVTLSVWMQLLHLVPNSFLWLMVPGNATINSEDFGEGGDQQLIVLRHLRAACAYHGIDWSTRVVVAKRTKKVLHIERHIAADIFLDTFVYGAHSTSTDSLRGGLPVATILGDSFPSRVASSLYHSFPSTLEFNFDDIFTAVSKKDFVEFLLQFFSKKRFGPSRRIAVNKLKLQLWRWIATNTGLFDADEHARRLLVALSALKEEKNLFYRKSNSSILGALRSKTKEFNADRMHIIMRPHS